MVAVIDNAVAGAIATLAASRWLKAGMGTHLLLGAAVAVALTVVFHAFQRWRIATAGTPTRVKFAECVREPGEFPMRNLRTEVPRVMWSS
jgi:hypothetical protein